MADGRTTLLDEIPAIAKGDEDLAAALRQAEVAARIVAREVSFALREGVAPARLRDFAERAFAEMLTVPRAMGDVTDASGRVLETGEGLDLEAVVDCLREAPGAPPATEVRLRSGGGDVVLRLFHAEPAVLTVGRGPDARVCVADPEGGAFVAAESAIPSGAGLRQAHRGANIRAA